MYLKFNVFLILFNLIQADEVLNNTNSDILVSYICEDTKIDEIQRNISLLQNAISNLIENVNLNLNQMNAFINTSVNTMNQQLMLQQQETKNFLQDLREEFLPNDCNVALNRNLKSGVYQIKIKNSKMRAFDAFCLRHFHTNEKKNDAITTSDSFTDWLVIQRRKDGNINFYRNYTDYQEGFGNLNGEFFIGLDKLHALTKSVLHELWIQLENFEGEKRWAKYSNFSIGNEMEAYELKALGTYTGNAGDGLSYHMNQKWSTKDVDNDQDTERSCAILYKGAWWYNSCVHSNLNVEKGENIVWTIGPEVNYMPKYVQMAIRPIN